MFFSKSVFFQGKFIRIHFDARGKLASADIETCKGNTKVTNPEHVISFMLYGIQQ